VAGDLEKLAVGSVHEMRMEVVVLRKSTEIPRKNQPIPPRKWREKPTQNGESKYMDR
jgi:hypothetical protein